MPFKMNRDKLALTHLRWKCRKRQKIDGYRKFSGAKFRERSALGVRIAVENLEHWSKRDEPFRFKHLGFLTTQTLKKK